LVQLFFIDSPFLFPELAASLLPEAIAGHCWRRDFVYHPKIHQYFFDIPKFIIKET